MIATTIYLRLAWYSRRDLSWMVKTEIFSSSDLSIGADWSRHFLRHVISSCCKKLDNVQCRGLCSQNLSHPVLIAASRLVQKSAAFSWVIPDLHDQRISIDSVHHESLSCGFFTVEGPRISSVPDTSRFYALHFHPLSLSFSFTSSSEIRSSRLPDFDTCPVSRHLLRDLEDVLSHLSI